MGTKSTTRFVCSNCGAVFLKWMGRCSQCNEWNTLEEQEEKSYIPNVKMNQEKVIGSKKVMNLSSIDLIHRDRIFLNFPEVDRPLGGGLVPGSVILWGGEPGIGKSTLIMQVCKKITEVNKKVLYCSGEESEIQLKMRAERLQFNTDNCMIYSESDLNAIMKQAEEIKPDLLIVDSIQTMFISGSESPMGSPSQIRDCTSILVKYAKSNNISVMIIGHVTKEGNLAGPRILEHMVDVVFYLEGDRNYQFRILRTVKNRFGSTEESGLFIMEGNGLKGIDDPSKYLLKERAEQVPGSMVVSSLEGLRPVLVEVQALVVHSLLAIPRRIASGYDYNRLIILLAVLEKRGRVSLATDDVYINVAGGFKVRETAADVSVILSLYSIKKDNPIPSGMMALGEVGLTGEIMPVSHVSIRIKEALKMKFDTFILPERNRREVMEMLDQGKLLLKKEQITFVKNVVDVLQILS